MKSIVIVLCTVCLFVYATAQRSFDAGDLIIRDDQGNVIKDLTQSPCYHEIGYNPDMPKQHILEEYEFCESEKRKKELITWGFYLFVGAFAVVGIRKVLKILKEGGWSEAGKRP